MSKVNYLESNQIITQSRIQKFAARVTRNVRLTKSELFRSHSIALFVPIKKKFETGILSMLK